MGMSVPHAAEPEEGTRRHGTLLTGLRSDGYAVPLDSTMKMVWHWLGRIAYCGNGGHDYLIAGQTSLCTNGG